MTMDIRQCSRCSKLFSYMGNRQCPACVQMVDKQFVDVRNYLDDHPGASIEDICEECDIEESALLGWLREGRLVLSRGSASHLACQRCGAAIKTGRYCEGCKLKVIDQLEDTAQVIGRRDAESKNRVHIRLS